MKNTKQLLSKFKTAIFFASFALGVVLVGETSVHAWDLNTADNSVRTALGTILFIIAAVLAIQAYAKGRKGVAIAEILVGAFLGIFVASSSPLESLKSFFSSVFGF